MIADWCVSGENTQECLDARARLNSSGLVSSIRQNLQRLDEYRRFPEKLQKYIHWKQKFLYDLLCNIETIEKMTTGWIKENGMRARQWAELYVLIKAIAESWQPLLDIFADTNAQCGVCRNERYNSQTWKFKLISMIIPDIPVIRFPKLPDIILDLSDIRMGIDLSVPDFNFVISPIRLPDLPALSLPQAPNVSLTLPSLPVLPALPNLPELPRLPSIPRIQLPDLPPPPKIPKLGGAIKGVLRIMKLISKMYCYYQNTYLIPEWQVGDVIAQRTERQSTLPIDFLDIHFPQINMPRFRDIRISTHVNFELKSDFLTEFARNTVEPINAFSTDLAGKLPAQLGENIRIDSPLPGNIHLDLSTPERANNSLENIQQDMENATENARDSLENAAEGLTGYQNLLAPIIAEMEADADEFLDVNAFATYFRGQLVDAGFDAVIEKLDHDMAVARVESEKLTQSLEDHNRERYRLMREFIREEERKTGKMQNLVDMLRAEDEALLARVDAVGVLASEIKESSQALEELKRLENKRIHVSMKSR